MTPSLTTAKRAVHSGANCRILLLCNSKGVFLGFEQKGDCVCMCVCVSGLAGWAVCEYVYVGG